jgi:hypothetical protein
MVRRRELPCIRRLKLLYRVRVVCGAMPMSMERKKSDEEAKKRETKGLKEK